MKKNLFIVIFNVILFFSLVGQNTTNLIKENTRPKLVVGIVIDQMRWDFLYRFYDRYTENGFKRLMNNGFNCENTFIPYVPTVTAAGHTCIYTGSVPSIHGIVGNNWYNKKTNTEVYCTEDNKFKTIGALDENGQMSPNNMLVTTICDELKLATNFKSKVIGIALKDRGAILPAGHSADAAYWYDSKTGNFITSSYYMSELPKWAQDFNAQDKVLNYYKNDWNTLYPITTYTQSDVDSNDYENTPFGKDQRQFPYSFKSFKEKNNYGIIRATPYGNSLTFDFAKSALINEQLGKDAITDFLAISFSSTDYIGHSFGPNSIEIEDTYLRFDKELADFLAFLDKQVGTNNYTVFLTADHGVAHIPAFLEKHKLPNGGFVSSNLEKQINKILNEKYGVEDVIVELNNQIYFNDSILLAKKIDKQILKEEIYQQLIKFPEIDKIFMSTTDFLTLPSGLKDQYINGYYKERCGEILFTLKPGYIDDEYGGKGTTHGVWSPYDAHIPLIFMGYKIVKGKTYEKNYMTDIAPTISSLLNIQMPNGCIGNAIKDAIKK